jgi:hypothetical protein
MIFQPRLELLRIKVLKFITVSKLVFLPVAPGQHPFNLPEQASPPRLLPGGSLENLAFPILVSIHSSIMDGELIWGEGLWVSGVVTASMFMPLHAALVLLT